jgi:hypothetical protein
LPARGADAGQQHARDEHAQQCLADLLARLQRLAAGPSARIGAMNANELPR